MIDGEKLPPPPVHMHSPRLSPVLSDQAVKMVCLTVLIIVVLHYTVGVAQVWLFMQLRQHGVELRQESKPSIEIVPDAPQKL